MNKKSKRRSIRVRILVIIFTVVLTLFVFFNFYTSTGSLSVENRTRLLDLGLVNYEKVLYGFYFPEYDRFGELFRWSGKESELLLEADGNIMIIPVFNPKPDLIEDPICIKIYINETKVMDYVQKGNELFNIQINLNNLDIKKNDIIHVKFESNKTWSPIDYGSSDDKREISFALREIKFAD